MVVGGGGGGGGGGQIVSNLSTLLLITINNLLLIIHRIDVSHILKTIWECVSALIDHATCKTYYMDKCKH